jgi:hypothetical protein
VRHLVLVLALVLGLTSLANQASAQVSAPPSVEVQDEGISQGRVRSLNCVGAGVVCTVVGPVMVITAAGGSGSANVAEVSVNLGTSGGEVFSVTLTGQTG